jgi:hypothetical protein
MLSLKGGQACAGAGTRTTAWAVPCAPRTSLLPGLQHDVMAATFGAVHDLARRGRPWPRIWHGTWVGVLPHPHADRRPAARMGRRLVLTMDQAKNIAAFEALGAGRRGGACRATWAGSGRMRRSCSRCWAAICGHGRPRNCMFGQARKRGCGALLPGWGRP